MLTKKSVEVFQGFLSSRGASTPVLHVVLGSGFGSALDPLPSTLAQNWELLGDLPFREIPGLFSSTVPDHAGKYRFLKNTQTGKAICFQMGRLHGYEGHPAREVVLPVMAPRLAGVKNFLLTNAAGGLSLSFKPGDVMLIQDQVNLTGQNPLLGTNPKDLDGKELGARFPDMCGLYERAWRESLEKCLRKTGLTTHQGTYMGLLGPSFETPAEVNLYSSWGMHAVGMSTVWEAIALKHSGATLAGLSLISNLGAGLGSGAPLDHFEILKTCRESASKIVEGIFQFLAEAKLS